YLGDRAAELRVCRLATLHLGLADLSGYLVIVAPDRPLADLPHALYEGLHRDLDRCLSDQRGIAALVDPSPAGPAPAESSPAGPAPAGPAPAESSPAGPAPAGPAPAESSPAGPAPAESSPAESSPAGPAPAEAP